MAADWPPGGSLQPRDQKVYGDLEVDGTSGFSSTVSLTGTTQSTSTTTGVLKVAGGIGVEKAVWSSRSHSTVFNPSDAGGDITGEDGLYLNGTEVVVNTPATVAFHDSATSGGEAYVDATASTFHATRFLSTSDSRAKTNIQSLTKEEALDRLARLRPVTYDFVGFENERTPEPAVGFIAQEVEQVCPEAVHTSPDGHLSLDQSQLIALLVRALQSD